MINKLNINKLNKLEEETLKDLNQRQIFLLMKKVTKEHLEDLTSEDKRERFINLRDYFLNQDIYSSYNCLNGMLSSLDNQRIALYFEKTILSDFINIVKVNKLALEFSHNLNLLKMVLSIAYSESESPNTIKSLNKLIERLYIDTWIYYEDSKPLIEIYKDNKKGILEKNDDLKQFFKDEKEIMNFNSIEFFEDINNLLFDEIERYEREFKTFESISEDGFSFLKEDDSEDNLYYDFEVFDIVRR